MKSNKRRVYRRVQQPKVGRVVTGKPDAEKLACPVWEGAVGNVSGNRQRAGRLLHTRGSIRTGLQQHLTDEEMHALGWYDEAGNLISLFKTPEQGASTTVWASVGRELEGIGGLYLADCNEALPFEQDNNGYMPYALNPDHAEQLWTLSQNLVER